MNLKIVFYYLVGVPVLSNAYRSWVDGLFQTRKRPKDGPIQAHECRIY